MSDTETDGLDEAFKGFGEDPAPVTPPAPSTPPVPDDPATLPVTSSVESPKKEEPEPAEEPKKDEEPVKKSEETPPAPAADEKKTEGDPKPPEAPETPAPAPTQPLTKDDVTAIISSLRNEERNSGKELETTAKEVMEAYYPEGLSNVLIDEKSGKELRSPQDVVDASGGQMSTDEAAQWLMNEQFKLDKQVDNIKSQAKEIAETTVNFKRDSMAVLEKYDPLFKAYPTLQQKAFDLMMKQVKVDKDKGVILSAPDVMDLYDTYLEPYQQAYEFSTKQPATNPTPPPGGEPPKPTAEDRMDEGGDGTPGGVPDDPNDFAQQVTKELAKGI